jgi:hypothetical protein
MCASSIIIKKINRLVRRYRRNMLSALAVLLLVSCAVSPEIQAKMDEYARTITSCLSDVECANKGAVARTWTLQNSDFNIRGESDIRINASSNILSQSDIGVTVTKIADDSGGFQLVADLECFSTNSRPEIWDLKVDFNKTINGTSE